MPEPRPQPRVANAHFVTDRLLIGGDLDAWDGELAVRQLHELRALGVTDVLDVRVEWSDEELVSQLAPEMSYLHLGIDDAGQRVPDAWFDRIAEWSTAALADPDVRYQFPGLTTWRQWALPLVRTTRETRA